MMINAMKPNTGIYTENEPVELGIVIKVYQIKAIIDPSITIIVK